MHFTIRFTSNSKGNATVWDIIASTAKIVCHHRTGNAEKAATESASWMFLDKTRERRVAIARRAAIATFTALAAWNFRKQNHVTFARKWSLFSRSINFPHYSTTPIHIASFKHIIRTLYLILIRACISLKRIKYCDFLILPSTLTAKIKSKQITVAFKIICGYFLLQNIDQTLGGLV